ncbi:uncharacterized protein LOC108031149 [Drosophila biarmipes]|uniref:uncharacterized protein LOC108031149 n=1 Tax=Drosophila biarmipes TaxID=125945 RepID=UPI0007E78C39|nr:uncharacterized protein LOC108031149 [Drosophila biarmipes]
MSQKFEGTETLTIEALEFIYEDEECLDIEPQPVKQDSKPVKLKRLVCNRNGCTYSTDRRRDLKRHRRSQKHEHEEYRSDSESDVDRTLYSCKVCDYTTANRFCYVRHKESRRHIVREMEECEKLMDEADRAELHLKRRKRVEKEPVDLESNTSQVTDRILFTSMPSDHISKRKSCPETHPSSQDSNDVQKLLEPSEYIEYLPVETEVEYQPFRQGSSTMECAACDYKTARRFAFVRHLQSTRHLARVQEWYDNVETPIGVDELEGGEEEHVVEQLDEVDSFHDLAEINALAGEDVMVEIEALQEQNGPVDTGSLVEIDGLVQTEPGFEVVEYAPAEENVYEEIVYLPTEDQPEDICYFIALEQ